MSSEYGTSSDQTSLASWGYLQELQVRLKQRFWYHFGPNMTSDLRAIQFYAHMDLCDIPK